jgi:hypothetical protein
MKIRHFPEDPEKTVSAKNCFAEIVEIQMTHSGDSAADQMTASTAGTYVRGVNGVELRAGPK